MAKKIPGPPLTLEDLYTIEGLAAAFPHLLSERTLRWQLRERETNGLDKTCVKVGKRLLISRSRYESWLGSRAEAV